MIKLLILDVDGVLTDGKKYYNNNGTVISKTFCDKDWTAIKRFQAIDIKVHFITGDAFNEQILKNRNLPVIVCRSNSTHVDKSEYLEVLCNEYNCTPKDVCFVGDDLFDIKLMKSVAYPYCVDDSPAMVKKVAKALPCNGGNNAIAVLYDVLEKIGAIQAYRYDSIIDKIYELDIKEKF